MPFQEQNLDFRICATEVSSFYRLLQLDLAKETETLYELEITDP